MRFTTQAEYGLICTLHLARFGDEGPVAAREMSEKEDLPADYTEKILRRLRQAGIVRSVRGVSGGFELARPATEISLASRASWKPPETPRTEVTIPA